METADPPAVDVATDACRKPDQGASPGSSPRNKMSLDVIAPQHHLHYPTVAPTEPLPVLRAASPCLAPPPPPSSLSQDAAPVYPGTQETAPAGHSADGADATQSASSVANQPLVEATVSSPLPSTYVQRAPNTPTAPNPQDNGSDVPEIPEIPQDSTFGPSSVPSSPLSTLASSTGDPATLETPQSQKTCSSPPPTKSDFASAKPQYSHHNDFKVDYEYEGPENHKILRLKPTVSEWNDFPSILSYARYLGAENDGCFKVVIPDDMLESLPERSSQKAPANAYQIRQVKRNGFWRVSTVPSEGLFNCLQPNSESLETVEVELQKLKKLFNKNKDKQIRSVRYRVDIPAWTSKQRMLAGVPECSPIHPLKGDKLDLTKAIIPGIHTPYVYESAAFFGATFQIHAEDYRLASLNHLYKGRKIWIVVPSTAVDTAEEALGRKKKCSQFMRHRAEFFFPDKLNKLGVPYRIVDQRPGETIVILPDAYHEGFSTGYTIAEAKNYAESDWTTSTYQACDEKCQLLTAIPAAYMRLLEDGEERLDLCARYADDDVTHLPKRPLEDNGLAPDAERDVKKARA